MDKLRLNLDEQNLKEEEKKLLDQMLGDETFLNRLSDLGIDEQIISDNLSTIFTSFDDYLICKNCPGLNKCPKDVKGSIIELELQGQFVERNISRCALKEKNDLLTSYYEIRDFDDKLLTLTPANLNDDKATKELLKYFYDFFKHEFTSNWLYLIGGTSKRKLDTLIGVYNKFASKYHLLASVINFPKQCRKLANLYFNEKERFEFIFNKLVDVPFLFLYDFGEEYKNETLRDNVLIPLLRARKEKETLTIFISDFSAEDIANMYNFNYASKARSLQIKKLLSSAKVIDFGELKV